MFPMTQEESIKGLIARLARIDASESWSVDLNPAQRSALEYLRQANRFSRSPSHAAAYLGTTRGTATQTFKALIRKGYVSEERSLTDKRSISYELTATGRAVIAEQSVLELSLDRLSATQLGQIETGLRGALSHAIILNGQKPFGICRSCRHFEGRGAGGYCQLLSLTLEPFETSQICHEQEPV
jgi:DNA-binding MarR family transcriptional regulator